jgi:Dolichyl-phosphate-mannose-protein mannosyltransferase
MKQTPSPPKKSKDPDPEPAPVWQPSFRFCVALLLAIIALFAIIRFRLRDMPLERDEGEYAYAGQLILQAVPPYKLAYNMKLPGTYAAYALIMAILGQTPAGIHLGLLLINAATILLMYILVTRLFGRLAGLVAAASYGLLTTSASVLGLEAHAAHFVVLPAIAGLLVLFDALDRKRPRLYLLSGFLLGLSFVMKQPGIFFAIFGGLYLLRREWTRPLQSKTLLTRFGLFTLGVVIPYGVICLIMWRAGVFGRFWFWTFSYARHYSLSFADGLHELLGEFPLVVAPSVAVWLIAAWGLTAFLWNARARRHASWCFGFLLFSCLAVSLGLRFSLHYFILLLPAVSLLASIAVSSATSYLVERNRPAYLRAFPVAAFLAVFTISILGQRKLLFETGPIIADRTIYGPNPFPEALTVADYLRSHTDPYASIAVIGSEPEIYFYAHRRSATGYIYTYALMENQPYALTMQNEMISEIESSRPEFVVVVDVPMSWMLTPQSQRHIFTWIKPYLRDHYEKVGLADIRDGQPTEYRWGEEAAHYHPQSRYLVYVYRHRN